MWLWLTCGSLAFVLGAIGLFLPVWPTTIFWIIAAFCFANSRPEWRDWIYARPGIGPVVEGFVERGILSRQSKTGALVGMVIGGTLATWMLWQLWTWTTLAWVLIFIGAVFVISRPTA